MGEGSSVDKAISSHCVPREGTGRWGSHLSKTAFCQLHPSNILNSHFELEDNTGMLQNERNQCSHRYGLVLEESHWVITKVH